MSKERDNIESLEQELQELRNKKKENLLKEISALERELNISNEEGEDTGKEEFDTVSNQALRKEHPILNRKFAILCIVLLAFSVWVVQNFCLFYGASNYC